MKKIAKFFANLFCRPLDVEKHLKDGERFRQIRQLFMMYHSDLDKYPTVPTVMSYVITHLDYNESKFDIKFIITLCRPGALIGKGGRNVNMIEQFLSERMGKPVEIIIKESKIWDTRPTEGFRKELLKKIQSL